MEAPLSLLDLATLLDTPEVGEVGSPEWAREFEDEHGLAPMAGGTTRPYKVGAAQGISFSGSSFFGTVTFAHSLGQVPVAVYCQLKTGISGYLLGPLNYSADTTNLTVACWMSNLAGALSGTPPTGTVTFDWLAVGLAA